jgi:hypothetical protein
LAHPDIADLLGLNEPTLIMTLNGAFDESGKHSDCEVVVFGGLVFDPEKTRTGFNRQWDTLLRGSKLSLPVGPRGPFLHMVELNRLHKKASRNRAEQIQIETLAESLAKCICEFALGGSLHSITIADFEVLPEKTRSRYKDPFYHAFEAGVIDLSEGAYVGPRDDIALICDDSDEYAVECLRAFKRLKKLEPAVAEKIPLIAFGDDKVFPPLQAADMLAYCYRAQVSNSEEGLWTAPLGIFLSSFSRIDHKEIRLSDEGETTRK